MPRRRNGCRGKETLRKRIKDGRTKIKNRRIPMDDEADSKFRISFSKILKVQIPKLRARYPHIQQQHTTFQMPSEPGEHMV
mmetsp:Transcript_9030/g.14276  ORF Transcript_9030/g.14276 Transcript_9030/m.14276 type:complete len:81 (-) Transcript_9030:569-811(-)